MVQDQGARAALPCCRRCERAACVCWSHSPNNKPHNKDKTESALQAVEAVLDDYDWVFYLDADAWITNPEIKLESVLPRQGLADFVVTADSTGLNAGSWMLRNSDWSREFLRKWWALTSFIQV